MKIVATSATGFLGRHTLPVLQDAYQHSGGIGVSSKDCDLMDISEDRRLQASARKVRFELIVEKPSRLY
jgi:GDP-L-fucose synthase